MKKTKLGISVGLLGAAIYFMGLFSGYMIAVILTGYVLLFEENEWLKKNAVKAVILMVVFSFITVVINLIPNMIGVVNNIFAIWGNNFNVRVLSRIITAVVSVIDIIEKFLLLGLGVKALNQSTISVPIVDNLIGKYVG